MVNTSELSPSQIAARKARLELVYFGPPARTDAQFLADAHQSAQTLRFAASVSFADWLAKAQAQALAKAQEKARARQTERGAA